MNYKEELIEKLAELCHSQWSNWMKYLFSKTNTIIKTGETVIPKWESYRWQKQMYTPYSKLSEEEKESDRTEARKFIELLRKEGVFEPKLNEGTYRPDSINILMEELDKEKE